MYNDSKLLIDVFQNTRFTYITDEEGNFLNQYFINKPVKVINYDEITQNTEKIQIIMYEQPDLLILNNNNLLAIEHFQVDYSYHTKKGSSFLSKYNANHKKIRQENIHERLKNENFVVETEKIETELSYENLYSNVITIFEKHYQKIDKYKKSINSIEALNYKKIEFIFFIEYNVVLPSFIITNNSVQSFVYPHNDIRLIKYLKTKKDISGVIFSVPAFNDIKGYMRFILTNRKNLKNYVINNKTIFDFSKISVEDFNNPIMTSTWISKKNLTTSST